MASGQMATGLLVMGRFGGMLYSAPVISAKNVPNPIRIGLAAILAVLLVPLLPAAPISGIPEMAAGLAKEVLLGLLLGWIVVALFSSAQMAGEWLDLQGGFQAGHLLNPMFDTYVAPIGNLKYMLAGLVFMAVGGHGLMIRGAAASFALSPPGAFNIVLASAGSWTALVARTLWIAVQMAAPIAVALLLAEVAVAVLSRAVPQVNIMLLTLPAKALMAVAGAALTIPILVRIMTVMFGGLQGDMAQAFRVVGG